MSLSVHVGMCRCMHMECAGTHPWSPETRDAEWAVPVHLEREAGPTVGPTGEGMVQGRLVVWAQRLQELQAVGMPWAPQKHQRNQLDSRAGGRAMLPWTPAVSCPLLAQLSWPFPPQEQCLKAVRRAGGTGGPQMGGDPVSAGLLGAGLLLCLEGVQVNRQGTARGDPGAGAALPGHWVHLSGNHWCHGR